MGTGGMRGSRGKCSGAAMGEGTQRARTAAAGCATSSRSGGRECPPPSSRRRRRPLAHPLHAGSDHAALSVAAAAVAAAASATMATVVQGYCGRPPPRLPPRSCLLSSSRGVLALTDVARLVSAPGVGVVAAAGAAWQAARSSSVSPSASPTTSSATGGGARGATLVAATTLGMAAVAASPRLTCGSAPLAAGAMAWDRHTFCCIRRRPRRCVGGGDCAGDGRRGRLASDHLPVRGARGGCGARSGRHRTHPSPEAARPLTPAVPRVVPRVEWGADARHCRRAERAFEAEVTAVGQQAKCARVGDHGQRPAGGALSCMP